MGDIYRKLEVAGNGDMLDTLVYRS